MTDHANPQEDVNESRELVSQELMDETARLFPDSMRRVHYDVSEGVIYFIPILLESFAGGDFMELSPEELIATRDAAVEGDLGPLNAVVDKAILFRERMALVSKWANLVRMQRAKAHTA